MASELSRRLKALERLARQDDRVTQAELSAGIARYRAALGEGCTAMGIPSAEQFGVMIRQMPGWLARTFALSVEPGDLLL